MKETKKLRPGVKESPFPTTPLLLGMKPKRYNILVGQDEAQERFAEQYLGAVCKPLPAVRDEDLLGQEETQLVRVEYARHIELSPQVRAQTSIWSLAPIEKGSAGANALVRHAAKLLELEKLDQMAIQRVADKLCEEEVIDVKAALWRAVWLLTGPVPDESKRWPEPWNTKDWLPSNVEAQYRLNSLYRDLVGIVFARENDESAAKKFHISPSKFAVLRGIAATLDLGRVNSSIRELSKWRMQKYNPLLCALKITTIWHSPVL